MNIFTKNAYLKKITALLFVFAFACSCKIFAQINAQGFGSTENEAKSAALNSLAQIFDTRVQSSLEKQESASDSKINGNTNSSYMLKMEEKILVSTQVELFGVEYETEDNGLSGSKKIYTVTASINPETAIPLYKDKIESTVKKINSNLKGIEKLSASKQEAAWNILASDYADLNKLKMILKVLGASQSAEPELSQEEFFVEYEKRSKEVTTLEKAASAVTANINSSSKSIYVYPALFESDTVPTEFSNVLCEQIKSSLGKKLSLTSSAADSFLKGSYFFVPGSVDGEDLLLTYYLVGSDGKVLSSSIVKIPYKVYSEYSYRPRSYNLQNEIANGRVSDPNFAVSVRINGERNGISLKEGDGVELEVRATEPCYIYAVGYVFNENQEKFSYLYCFDYTADGKEKFVKRISTKDAGKWVVINPLVYGEVQSIEIVPPYGEETLQVFASTTNDFDAFVGKIPSYTETDDFYLISGEPEKTVSKTRALAIKKAAAKASKAEAYAESSVSWSSHK